MIIFIELIVRDHRNAMQNIYISSNCALNPPNSGKKKDKISDWKLLLLEAIARKLFVFE